MRSLLPLSAALLFGASSLALAEDYRLNSEVASVDLYPDGVILGRAAQVEVSAGSHEITLDALPMNWDPRSLSVKMSGMSGLSLKAIAIRHRAEDSEVKAKQEAFQAKAEDLLKQIDATKTMVNTLLAEKKLVEAFIADPKLFSARPDALDFWQHLVARHGAVDPEIELNRLNVAALNEQWKEAQKAAADLNPKLYVRQVVLQVEAPSAGAVSIDASYFSNSARWQPSYTIDVTSADDAPTATVKVTQAADIWQETGEDWAGVGASLHSASANAYLYVPTQNTLSVDQGGYAGYGASLKKTVPEARGLAFEEVQMAELSADMATNVMAPAEPEAAQVQSGFTSIYDLPGTLTLDSGMEQQQTVLLESQEAQADLWVQVVAAQNPLGTLMVGFDGPLSAPALPGYATFTRDGSFVGNTYLAAMQPGEALELPFGIDPLSTIRRDVISDVEGEEGFIGRRDTHARTIVTHVESAHTFPMPFRLIEATPVSRHEDILVELTRETDGFDVTDLNGQEGVIRWDVTLEPTQATTRTLDYIISWPRDMVVNLN